MPTPLSDARAVQMLTTIQRAMMVPSSPPSLPRLMLSRAPGGRAVLDGGWWPRSWDPVAEVPGLIVRLSDRYGPIQNVMLNRAAWDHHFRRLAAGTQMIRLGWFATLDAALLIATTNDGVQLELLVVPPTASSTAATEAMTIAADETNTMSAPDILAARCPPAAAPGNEQEQEQEPI